MASSFLSSAPYPSTYGGYKNRKPHHPLRLSASLSSSSSSSSFSYAKFIQFAVTETERHTRLIPSSLQEKYNSVTAIDGRTELRMLSFQSPKIRLLRSLSIENETMQVLDFAGFARPEFDVPIFCANFFTTANINIIVLDLNPLHDIVDRKDYKEKYYAKLMALGLRYSKLFPWGGKLTSESLKFFSPIVIWAKFPPEESMYDGLYSAFTDYYTAWLHLIDEAEEETDEVQVRCNREAQHRYLTWRAEKVITLITSPLI
ncbi:Phytochromobilin:ferredoxin oxidoreductase, chloroplastic [Linum perenne]